MPYPECSRQWRTQSVSAASGISRVQWRTQGVSIKWRIQGAVDSGDPRACQW